MTLFGVPINAGCLSKFPANRSLVPMFLEFKKFMRFSRLFFLVSLSVNANPNHDGSLKSVAFGSSKNSCKSLNPA